MTVAATPDGSLALVYLPTKSTLTVDLSKFSGPVRGTWFDPVNGARDIGSDVFKNSGQRKFSHEMKNAGGDSDWVLVLETEREKP